MSAAYDPAWGLTPADRLLVEAKRWGNRLRFAVMLVFFCARGRFPRTMAEMDEDAVAELSRTLGVPVSDSRAALLPDADNRTLKRQRAEIRALLGFREATVADADNLGAWLRDTAVGQTRDIARLTAAAEAWCHTLHIEPPTPERVVIGAAAPRSLGLVDCAALRRWTVCGCPSSRLMAVAALVCMVVEAPRAAGGRPLPTATGIGYGRSGSGGGVLI